MNILNNSRARVRYINVKKHNRRPDTGLLHTQFFCSSELFRAYILGTHRGSSKPDSQCYFIDNIIYFHADTKGRRRINTQTVYKRINKSIEMFIAQLCTAKGSPSFTRSLLASASIRKLLNLKSKPKDSFLLYK